MRLFQKLINNRNIKTRKILVLYQALNFISTEPFLALIVIMENEHEGKVQENAILKDYAREGRRASVRWACTTQWSAAEQRVLSNSRPCSTPSPPKKRY